MKTYALIILGIGLMLMYPCKEGETEPVPVSSNASPEARALLKFLYEIRGNHTLSGQHNFISTGSKYTNEVFRITGKYPVM